MRRVEEVGGQRPKAAPRSGVGVESLVDWLESIVVGSMELLFTGLLLLARTAPYLTSLL